MAAEISVNGVDTWYEETGQGDPVVLLHGGLTDSRDFPGSLSRLDDRFRLLLPERRGHGHTPDAPGPITVALMAQDTIAFVEEAVGGPAHLVGYSAGATVALKVAILRPDLVEKLVLISGAFDRDGMIPRPTADMEPPPALVSAYGEVSPDGVNHFPVVIAKVARSLGEEPGLAPRRAERSARAGASHGCRQRHSTLEHSVTLYRALARAQLAIVPHASHLLLFEHPELCTDLVARFLSRDPAPTMMPIARAAQHHPAMDGEGSHR